jgi:hypothetical protein
MRIYTHFLSDKTADRVDAKAYAAGLQPEELVSFIVEQFIATIGDRPLSVAAINAMRPAPELLRSFADQVIDDLGGAGCPDWMKS